MNKYVYLCSFAAIMGIMAGCAQQTKVSEPQKTKQEAPKAAEERIAFDFPKDYKNWTHGTSKIILDKGSPLYGFQQVFVNDAAIDSYKKGGGYPDGSIIVIGFY